MNGSHKRVRRQIIVASTFVLIVIVLGTAGYMVVEGWNITDAFYMVVLSISTTGFQEVHPLSEAGQLLTVFIIILGLSSIAYLGGRAAQFFVESYLFRRRRMDLRLRRMRDHYIVCGFGRMGRHIAADLDRAGRRFVVIERQEEKADALSDLGYLYVIGDATSDEILTKAGIEEAKGLITVVSSDAENVFTALSARTLNPAVFVVSRALTDESESKLLKAGANRVIKPYEAVGRRMAQLLIRPGVVEFMDMVGHGSGRDIAMEEITVLSNSPLVGKTLRDSPIRQDLNIIIVALHRAGGEFIYNPASTVPIEDQDKLIAVGQTESLHKLAALCAGSRK